MTNINPNDGVNRINHNIKKENKVNKKEKPVAQTKQVEASSLNALSAYGKANINFKGKKIEPATFDKKKKDLQEKIEKSLIIRGENYSKYFLEELFDLIKEDNIDLATQLFLGKTSNGNEIIENKQLACCILLLIKECPEYETSLIKRNDNKSISIDFDKVYETITQVINEEAKNNIDVGLVKQIFELKNENGNNSFNYEEIFEILSSINDENLPLAKKLIFNKDEQGNELPNIKKYLDSYNANHHLNSKNLTDIIENITAENIEFAEELLYGNNFSEKEYISEILSAATQKTIPTIKKILFEKKSLFDDTEEASWVISKLNDENLSLAKELLWGKDENGKELFENKKIIYLILNRTNKNNINIIRALCFGKDEEGKELFFDKEAIPDFLFKWEKSNFSLSFLSGYLYESTEKNETCSTNRKSIDTLIRNHANDDESELLTFLEDIKSEKIQNKNSAIKDLNYFLKAINNINLPLAKKIYSSSLYMYESDIQKILSLTTSDNIDFIEKLCFGKDEKGKDLFPLKYNIYDIVKYTKKDTFAFAEKLCFGKDKDGNDIFKEKKYIGDILKRTQKNNLAFAEKLCFEKDKNGDDLFKEKNLIADILYYTTPEKLKFAENLCFGKDKNGNDLYKDKGHIRYILDGITKQNISFAEKLCFAKDKIGNDLFPEKGYIASIIKKTNINNIKLAEKFCFGKDEDGNDLFPDKAIFGNILENTNQENLSFCEKLCFGKDKNGKELFPKKEYISYILRKTTTENIIWAEKLCFEKNIDNEALINDVKIISEILSKITRENTSEIQMLFDALYNKQISENSLLCILNKDITLEEFENTIKIMNEVDSARFPSEKCKDNREKLNNLKREDLLIIAKNIKLYGKNNINEISIADKKIILRDLMKQNINLFGISENLQKDFPLIPKNAEEYCSLLKGLVKSMGIQTNEITTEQEKQFDKATQNLASSLSNISDEEFVNLSISQEYAKDDFIQDVLKETKMLNSIELQKVYDYFGFELKQSDNTSTGYTIIGYPASLNNGVKLAQIEEEKTKQVVEQLRPYVIKFTENNKINCNNKEIEIALNEIAKVLPEIRTFIGKTQHKTQAFDIMKHSLKVMQKITQNPKFESLNDSDKKIILLASLLHDSAKSEGNIDPIHAKESSFDAFYISQKFNLTKDERIKLYSIIEHHEWLADINKEKDPQRRAIQLKSKAYDLQYDNLFELSKIFTEADLKAVKIDDRFFDKFKNDFNVVSQEVESLISTLKTSQPLLPVTKLPTSSKIKEAITVINDDYSTNLKGIYVDEKGLVIIKYNEVENDTWEKIGFPKGSISRGIEHTIKVFSHKDAQTNEPVFKEEKVNTGNIHFFVHGLDYANQLSNFDAFSLPDSDALLSVSYAEKPESKYRFFRPQGVILNTDAKYVHGGGETDHGSGYGKNIDEFKKNYAYEGSIRHSDRTFISDLIKEELGLSQQEYLELINKYKNKPFTNIQPQEIQEKIIKALSKINSHIRKGDRSYNEMYISNPDIMGFFAYSWNKEIGSIKDFVNETKNVAPFIKENAVEKDMPLIVFGD